MADTFGRIIAAARKDKRMSLKELAGRVKKENGSPISPQYLNDIEHDRRNPPYRGMIDQLATELDLSKEYLYFLADQYPEDISRRKNDAEPKKVEAAFKAFREAFNREDRQ